MRHPAARLLHIDPSATFRAIVAQTAKDEGWRAHGCISVEEALAHLDHHPCDMVVCAALIGAESYKDLVDQIRRREDQQQIPIMLLTTGTPEMAEQAMQDGITEVFYKDRLEDFGFYLRIAREHETSLTPAPMKRALLVEDDKAQAKFLQCVLADLGYQAVLAATAEEAMAQVEAEDWHLAVVDLVLAQGQSGNAVIRYIRSHGLRNRMPIVVISGLLDEARRVEALRSGANLYVEKPIQADTLGLYIRNLEAIHGGGQQNGDAGLGDRIRSLTERERSVYELMAGGHSDKQIAERLGISFWTVRTHAGRIFRKFDVTNRVELIRKSSAGNGVEAAQHPAHPDTGENGDIAACMEEFALGIVWVDENGLIRFANRYAQGLTGYDREELLGLSAARLIAGRHGEQAMERIMADVDRDGRWLSQGQLRRKDGSRVRSWVIARTFRAPKETRRLYVVLFSDVFIGEASGQQPLSVRLLHDPLTGLANRTLLEDRGRQEIARAYRQHTLLGVLFLDLDRFKAINDTYGHRVGDKVLKRVAQRLEHIFRKTDTVSRFGGDEFVILVPDLKEKESCVLLAMKALQALQEPIRIGEVEHRLGASIGIAWYPDDGLDMTTLIGCADQAMYRAKADGGNVTRCFNEAMRQAASHVQSTASQLRSAVENGDLRLHLQPRRHLDGSPATCAEVSLHWFQGAEEIPAARLLQIAEQSGQIDALSHFLIQASCKTLRELRKTLGAPLMLALNVTPSMLYLRGFGQFLASCLAENGLEPADLALEFPEKAFINPPQTGHATMERLRQQGFRLILDNFGAGASNLELLHRFHFDAVKIAAPLVADLPESPYSRALVSALVDMGRELGLSIIAAGVSTADQATALEELGCQIVQGPWVSPPLEVATFLRQAPSSLIRERQRPPEKEPLK